MSTTLYSFVSAALATGVTNIPQTAITGYTQNLTVLVTQAVGANALLWANPSTSIAIDMQVSYDGGSTWVYGGGSTHVGGSGAPLSLVTQMGGVYQYGATPTHFKGTITIANGPITIAGSVVAN